MDHRTPRDMLRNKNVLALGWASLLDDFASEMAYPIIPIFLTATLGAPVALFLQLFAPSPTIRTAR